MIDPEKLEAGEDGALRLYDPNNPEHYLIDSVSSEWNRVVSPRFFWWKLNTVQTDTERDEIDELYQETTVTHYEAEPRIVYAYVEKSPIIEELSRAGLTDVDELVVTFNITDIENILEEAPKSGDMFTIAEFRIDEKSENVFYRVASVVPSDIVNWRYTNYTIMAELTALETVPETIRKFARDNIQL